MQLRVRTHQGGYAPYYRQHPATETQSRPPVKSFFLKGPRVKRQFVSIDYPPSGVERREKRGKVRAKSEINWKPLNFPLSSRLLPPMRLRPGCGPRLLRGTAPCR